MRKAGEATKKRQEDINKMTGTTYFHYVPLLFALLLEKRTRSKSLPEKA